MNVSELTDLVRRLRHVEKRDPGLVWPESQEAFREGIDALERISWDEALRPRRGTGMSDEEAALIEAWYAKRLRDAADAWREEANLLRERVERLEAVYHRARELFPLGAGVRGSVELALAIEDVGRLREQDVQPERAARGSGSMRRPVPDAQPEKEGSRG